MMLARRTLWPPSMMRRKAGRDRSTDLDQRILGIAGKEKPVTDRIREILFLWRTGAHSHAECTAALLEVADRMDSGVFRSSEDIFRLEKAMLDVGLFTASLGFRQMAEKSLEREARSFGRWRQNVTYLRLAIHSGDLEKAKSLLLLSGGRNFEPVTELSYRQQFQKEAVNYIRFWSGEASFGPNALARRMQQAERPELLDLAEKSCLVVGPAPMQLEKLRQGGHDCSVQTLAPGASASEGSIANLPSSTSIVCMNSQTESWLMGLSVREAHAAIGGADIVLCKTHWFAEASRKKFRWKHVHVMPSVKLLMRGTPNLIPHVIYSLMSVQLKEIFVAGVTFFTGLQPYREARRRRSTLTGIRVDGFGSDGQEFRLCKSMGENRVFENWRLIRNLASGPLLSGDPLFGAAVEMSESEYATNLDRQYGSQRR